MYNFRLEWFSGCISTLFIQPWLNMCVCTVSIICMTVYLPLPLSSCMYARDTQWIFIRLCVGLCLHNQANLTLLFLHCASVALSLSPLFIRAGTAGCTREGKIGTMNDIGRQHATRTSPPSFGDTELIADSRCVSKCGRVGRSGCVCLPGS